MKAYSFLPLLTLIVGAVLPVQAQDAEPAASRTQAGETSEPAGPKGLPNMLQNMETLDNETNKVSYAIGVNIARNLQHSYPDLNIDFFMLALRDVMGGNRPRLNEQMINEGIVKFSEEAKRTVQSRVKRVTDQNLENAEQFLEENGKKEGVITTASGLQYRVIHEGSGAKPTTDSEVQFRCTTKLQGGQVVDSTAIEGNEPLKIKVADAIPAWKEAIPMMNVGSKWELYVHPGLAYGKEGAKNIGPNELLIFRIELLSSHQ